MGTENVMFFVLSTLNNFEINTYHIREKNEDWYFKGISQLEPHTKYVISTLAKKGEKLKRIVILASKEARDNQKTGAYKGDTALTFYKNRIKSYLRKEIPSYLTEGIEDKICSKKETAVSINYSNEEIEKLFCTIKLEDETFFWDAAEKIVGDSSNEINLYLDVQGGDRNSLAQMNAIIELLSNRNVNICGRYANDYRRDKELPLHEINEVSEQYKTYELITAMEMFRNYGWGDKLVKFFENRTTIDNQTQNLVAAIEKATQAISLCKVDEFDDSIREIESLRNSFSGSGNKRMIDIVFKDIEDDYKFLFGAKYRYVEQIRWCLRKNFTQQAITIFESKMPYEFVMSGMVYYCDNQNQKMQVFQKVKNMYDNWNNIPKYKFLDLNHFFIRDYQIFNGSGAVKWYTPANRLAKFGVTDNAFNTSLWDLICRYKEICKMRNQINHVASSTYPSGGFHEFMKQQYPNDDVWRQNSTGIDLVTHIREFLDDWEKLANQIPENVRATVIDLS